MTAKSHVSETQYGFIDGPVEVIRLATLPDGTICIQLKTKFARLNVYSSPTGRSLRVFRNGVGELKPQS